MDYGLEGKVALVTGTASQIGFGKAIALTLAKEGCDIIANDIDIKGAERTAIEIKALGRKAIAIKADVANREEVNNMVNNAMAEFGRIDILVNNTGVGSAGLPFVETKEAEWDRLININFKGMLNCTKAVLPQMLARKSGKIVNLSSGLGKTGGPNSAVYSGTKGAVIAFTKSLAAEVAASGINVNCVAPGLSPSTNFSRNPDGSSRNAASHERQLARTPIGRHCIPQDVAIMVAYLVSDAASNVVGQPISVDGGSTMI